jgi:hypothetical protein
MQMARLNDGLAMFDAILIVPMLQIAWTFFSIFTGFIYFEEYRVCTAPTTISAAPFELSAHMSLIFFSFVSQCCCSL